jgi:predicted thioesterase
MGLEPGATDTLTIVVAADDYERVGEGTHERFVVDLDRFMGRIAAKGR